MTVELKSFARTVRVTDGAWGTQLQSRGLPAGSCGELWNVDNSDPVEAIARSYVEAGSEVILTNTFGANRFVLDAHGESDRVAELCRAGAAISRRVAGKDVKVFGSIGPTGKIVMMGEVSPSELVSTFSEAAAALSDGGVDALVLETFNELEELKIAIEAIKNTTDLPVVACMTFGHGSGRDRTMMGNSPEELVDLIKHSAAEAVGANCGCGPDGYVEIAARLRAATSSLPIWVKANAGLPEIGPDGHTVYPMQADDFALRAKKIVSAGANFIGGCCGTTPEHIRAIREMVGSA